MTTGENGITQTAASTGASQKKRIRSPYLFPAYNFNLAYQITERVEKDGAGTLSEETLAIALHLSAKSSGFQLKTLTARQFGLLTKQGQALASTPLAKRIFKPTSEDEKKRALVESFLAIPLFREVATRFRGQPLPQSQAFRNILEREFGIDSKRVSDAERVLIDSARDTGALVTSGPNTYLSTELAISNSAVPPTQGETPSTPSRPSIRPASSSASPGLNEATESGSKLLTVSVEDFKNFEGKEFDDIWAALGKIVKARSKRLEEPKKE